MIPTKKSEILTNFFIDFGVKPEFKINVSKAFEKNEKNPLRERKKIHEL